MAHITVIAKNDLVSISLDQWEWTGLNVNGNQIPSNNGYNYQQQTPGQVNFTATASGLNIENPNNIMFLAGPVGSNQTYCCIIGYYNDGGGNITLQGTFVTLPQNLSEAQKGPIGFSQGGMMGSFSLGS